MTDEPPEDAETFVWLYDELTVVMSEESAEEYADDHRLEEPPGLLNHVKVVFEEGDELPTETAREAWSGFKDRMAAFDADGNRLDDPSRIEEQNFDKSLVRYQ